MVGWFDLVWFGVEIFHVLIVWVRGFFGQWWCFRVDGLGRVTLERGEGGLRCCGRRGMSWVDLTL